MTWDDCLTGQILRRTGPQKIEKLGPVRRGPYDRARMSDIRGISRIQPLKNSTTNLKYQATNVKLTNLLRKCVRWEMLHSN